MSVRVAAETISNSVADSLQLLLNKKINGFEGCKPTIEYIRCFNDLFDVMNSKYENAIGLKKPINEENIESIISLFEKSITYIEKLKLNAHGKCVLKSKCRTGFRGFIQNMRHFKMMYTKYIENGVLDKIVTYRFSQDHLEILFGRIRQMFGCNNNPTVLQFESAFRKLLGQHQIEASQYANCQDHGKI